MQTDNTLVYAEVDEILNLLEDEYRNKIPQNVIDFFNEEKDPFYIPHIDTNKPLIEQNLTRETLALLATINLNYWCETEDEKQQFLNELSKNEDEKKQLEQNYSIDNLFENNSKNIATNLHTENLQLVEYKEPNFIQKLFEKLSNILKKFIMEKKDE